MLAAVRHGQIGGSWPGSYIASRGASAIWRGLTRPTRPPGLIATMVDQIDTRQATGPDVAELLAAQARTESESTSLRVARQHEVRVKQEEPSLCGIRAFGYARDFSVLIPEEAALIREATQGVLAGEGLGGICADWAERGVRSRTRKVWRPTSLHTPLMRATLSGNRSITACSRPLFCQRS